MVKLKMAQENPTVSVIIPVFNGTQYIQDALESVASQTFKDFEIIVVDDGSTDSTKAVLEPWIKRGAIHYIYQDNKGLAAARNTGIRQAKGKYLKFLDCDDLLYPRQLELQVAHLQQKPRTIISASDYDLEFASKKKINVHLYLKENQLAKFIEGNPCPVHTLLVDRSLVQEAGGFDEKLRSHEDSDLWIRVLLQSGCFERVDYTGCCYRIHDGALSAQSKDMFLYYSVFSENLNRALLPQLPKLPRETLQQLYFKNLQCIHQSFAQNFDPSKLLALTLKVNHLLFIKKASIADKYRSFVLGFKSIAKEEYEKSCRLDPRYPQKLLSTAWRQEEFYQWEKYPYLKKNPRNKKIKNILFLNSSSVIYGAETRLLDILRQIDTDKFHPFVLLPHPGPLGDRLKEMGIVVDYLEYGFPIQKLDAETIKRVLRINRDFVRLARRHDIDLIHANLHINMSKFWIALMILRLPVIVHMRSHFWLDPFEQFVICRSSRAICISKFVENSFLRKRPTSLLMGHRPGHTQIMHDGIDTKFFEPFESPGYIRKEFKIDPHDFLIGIIGAVDKVKGQDLVLEALSLVVPKHPQVKLLIVGDLYHHGKSNLAFRDGLLKFIKDSNLTDKVIFTGVRHDINFIMNEIDLLLQPSEREALGTSMVEAMACGKPVIGTRVDGIPEVIGEDEGGIVLKQRTPQALAEAINFFIENPQEARKRGLQGRQRVLKLFNVYENIKVLQNVYGEVLEHQW